MKLVGVTRLLAVAMAGVLCFGIIVPLAWSRHAALIAIGAGVVYLLYAVANVLAWNRLRPRC